MKTNICELCNKEYPCKRRKQRFCSLECHKKNVAINTRPPHKIICEWCGKEFEPTRKGHKFCCQKCYFQKYYKKNKDEILTRRKLYRNKPKNKEKRKAYEKEYRQNYREEISKKKKEYCQIPEVKRRRKKYCQIPEVKRRRKKYYQIPEVKIKINGYYKKRRKEDPIFKLKQNLRNRLSIAFKKYSKTGKIMKSKDYGIEYKKIIEHLKPFPKNIEDYEIDHIIPLSWFNFNSLKEIKWAFAPENHQWLLKEENMHKGDRFMG